MRHYLALPQRSRRWLLLGCDLPAEEGALGSYNICFSVACKFTALKNIFFPSIAEPPNIQIIVLSSILKTLGRMLCSAHSLLIVLNFKYGLLLRFLLGSVTTLSSASSAAGFSSCRLWSCASFHAVNEEAQG